MADKWLGGQVIHTDKGPASPGLGKKPGAGKNHAFSAGNEGKLHPLRCVRVFMPDRCDCDRWKFLYIVDRKMRILRPVRGNLL